MLKDKLVNFLKTLIVKLSWHLNKDFPDVFAALWRDQYVSVPK